jgi:hypothetical protein
MDIFNIKKIKTLQGNIDELNQNINNIKKEQYALKASYDNLPPRGANNQKQQRALSEITPRNPFRNYQFGDTDQGVGHKYLFETTLAKRILSIKPRYAMAEPPIIADVDNDGEVSLETPFVTDVKRIMESRRGVSTNSPSLFNGNFSGFEKITEADAMSYGRWGGIYLVFDDTDQDPNAPTQDAAMGEPKKLIGMQPLDEGCLWFDKPTNDFNVQTFNIKIDNQAINNVHHSRIVLITDNDSFEHIPRLMNIENEVRNIQDMLLSMMASIAVSRPKIATSLDSTAAAEVINKGVELDALLESLNNAMLEIVQGDNNIMTAIGSTLPQFIQPQLLEIAPQLLSNVNSVSSKTGIPSLMILGSEVGSLSSSKDKENFLDSIKQYRNHTRKITRNVVSRLINAGAVSRPSNVNQEFDIFWAEDKAAIIENNIKSITAINSVLTSNAFNDDTKSNLTILAEKLVKEML